MSTSDQVHATQPGLDQWSIGPSNASSEDTHPSPPLLTHLKYCRGLFVVGNLALKYPTCNIRSTHILYKKWCRVPDIEHV